MSIVRVLEVLLYAIALVIVLPSLAFGLAGGGDTGTIVSIIVLAIGVVVFGVWLVRQLRRHSLHAGGGKA